MCSKALKPCALTVTVFCICIVCQTAQTGAAVAVPEAQTAQTGAAVAVPEAETHNNEHYMVLFRRC